MLLELCLMLIIIVMLVSFIILVVSVFGPVRIDTAVLGGPANRCSQAWQRGGGQLPL
jgi:hypothetical protein